MDVRLEAGLGPDIKECAGGHDQLSGTGSDHTLHLPAHSAVEQVPVVLHGEHSHCLRANMVVALCVLTVTAPLADPVAVH